MIDTDDPASQASRHIDDIMTSYDAFTLRARTLRPTNKAALFTALGNAGIARVIVTFDGCGDSGQIENVEVQGDVSALPEAMIVFAFAQYSSDEPEHRTLSIADAVEEFAYDCLRERHDGWENNDGAFGEFHFDVARQSITLDFNYRITSTDSYTHEF